jgi:bacteriocin biosynthesis cyclodehydratase domain-containing protein
MTVSEPTKSLKPWYRIYKGDNSLIFHYGDSVICLKGRAAEDVLPKLLPMLDGRHSIDQIERIVGENAEITRAAIGLLERYELLMDGVVPLEQSDLARTAVFLSSIGGASITENIGQRLACASVTVVGSSDVALEIIRGLQSSGIGEAKSGDFNNIADGAPDLLIAAPSQAEASELRDLNSFALRHKQIWMQVLQYDGRFAAIGPIFVPHETACYACYQLRRASNVKYPNEYLELDKAATPFEQCAAVDLSVAGLAILHALRWIGAQDPSLAGNMLAFQPFNDRATSLNHVLRVPRCQACSLASSITPPSPWHES